MLYTVLPMGLAHGWGICGRYLARHLSALTETRLIVDDLSLATVGDELELHHLRGLLAPEEERGRMEALGDAAIDAPVLQWVENNRTLMPARPNIRGVRNIGYAFFEENVLPREALDACQRHFDTLALGSTWCTQVLRDLGAANVATVLQGVDSNLFHPNSGGREFLKDRFVVFSGGKFEFRKGQDLVIRAYRVLQDRHQDVCLLTQWYLPPDPASSTMRNSPYIQFAPPAGDQASMILHTLAANGIDTRRVVSLRPRLHSLMATVYWNSDVGLFPNRCEGGSNLVLMEYMACGRAAIASYSSGHRDIVNPDNALLLRTMQPLTITRGEETVAVWDDPSLEEMIEQLEWAYQHPLALKQLGEQAGNHLARFSWKQTARQLYHMAAGGVD